MKPTFFAAIAIAACLGAGMCPLPGAEQDPAEILRDISKLRSDRLAAAKKADQRPDYSAISAEATAKAARSVEGLDPATLDLAVAKEWVQVFNLAKDYQRARTVAERWAGTADGKERFDAQLALMSADYQLKDAKALLRTLKQTRPVDTATAIRLATLANGYVAFAFNNADKATAMKVLEAAERAVPKGDFTSDREKEMAARAEAEAARSRKLIDENPGKEAEVPEEARREALIKLLTSRSGTSTNAAKAREEREAKFAALIGTPARELAPTHQLGKAESLEQLKGKVVMLDFFAHWCGPCIASLPSVRELYEDLGPKGLQVLGVTRFYGYYQSENRSKRDMAPEMELARMEKFVAEKKITWPVLFVERPAFEAYACSAIPHVVLIDKEGKICKIKVGYNPNEKAEFRKAVEDLLGE